MQKKHDTKTTLSRCASFAPQMSFKPKINVIKKENIKIKSQLGPFFGIG